MTESKPEPAASGPKGTPIRIEFHDGAEVTVHLPTETPPAKTKWERRLILLSNPFILWVLGSLVVSLAGFFWTMSSGCVRDGRANAKQVHRLQGEILVRLGDARLEVAKVKAGNGTPEAQTAVFRTAKGKGGVMDRLAWRELPEKFQATFPEFSQRTMWAMLRELQQIGDGVEKANAAKVETSLSEMVAKLDSASSLDAAGLDVPLAAAETQLTARVP